MERFDDIVIGSGLAALGVVFGLGVERRVLVLGGLVNGQFSHYDGQGAVPCAYSGMGGLGGYWHGVIPVSRRHDFEPGDTSTFAALFKQFYPNARIDDWLSKPALFVPWRPIRPAVELLQRIDQGARNLRCEAVMADRIEVQSDGALVRTADSVFHARRVWVAAGAVRTPELLVRSFGPEVRRTHISDHVLCYVGHVDHVDAPRTSITRDGVYFPCYSDPAGTALYTLRPARFGFRQLDYGIEQRAAFGLPTGNAVAKIARSMSPGLLAEAFYNRCGVLAKASRYSIYAQIQVDRAYELTGGNSPLKPDLARIHAAAALAREKQPFAGAALSRRPDLYIPGIHLHHSLDLAGMHEAGLLASGSVVKVIDASRLENIGAEHHSFKMLCAAYQEARLSA